MVRSALDEAYGAGKVSMVSAAFRWLHHHSQMKPECNGEGTHLVPYREGGGGGWGVYVDSNTCISKCE